MILSESKVQRIVDEALDKRAFYLGACERCFIGSVYVRCNSVWAQPTCSRCGSTHRLTITAVERRHKERA